MSRTAFANLGADENDKRSALRVDDVRRPQSLRRLAEVWLGLVEDPPAAWSWLERARGFVPWVATPLAHEVARERGERLWGAAADVVAAVNGRVFAASLAPRLEDEASPYRDVVVVDLRPDDATTDRRRELDVRDVVTAFGTTDLTVRANVGGWNGWVQAGNKRVDLYGAPESLAVIERREPPERTGPAAIDVALSALWYVDEHGEPHALGVTNAGRKREGTRAHEIVLGPYGPRAGTPLDDEMLEKSRLVVEAAAAQGYRGPCSVEGFLYKRHGRVALRACASFDARFTDGHVALGMLWRHSPSQGSRWRFRIDDVRTLEELPRELTAAENAAFIDEQHAAELEGGAVASTTKKIGRPRGSSSSTKQRAPAVVRRKQSS